MIYFIKHSVLPFLFFLPVHFLQAQVAYEQMDKAYGPDPLLFNGRKYTYFLPPGTGGNQFLQSDEFVAGEVRIKGKVFTWASLNYDIYNQQILLKYQNDAGAQDILELSKAWLEGFRLGGKVFIILKGERDSRTYQVLGSGPYYILFYWRKDLKLSNTAGISGYSFSKALKTSYVMTGGKIHPFRSAGGFVNLFDPSHRAEIKNYIHTEKIKFRAASDEEMANLINYIGKL